MTRIKEYLPVINVLALIGSAIFIFMNCSLSRSPLVDDPTYPVACKTILEGDYFHQKQDSQASFVAMMGESCKGQLSMNYCDKWANTKLVQSDNRSHRDKWDICMAKQGK